MVRPAATSQENLLLADQRAARAAAGESLAFVPAMLTGDYQGDGKAFRQPVPRAVRPRPGLDTWLTWCR
jgi:hypothetical protein